MFGFLDRIVCYGFDGFENMNLEICGYVTWTWNNFFIFERGRVGNFGIKRFIKCDCNSVSKGGDKERMGRVRSRWEWN